MSTADFYIRRLHSIAGVVPIGFFMLEHLFTISQAMAGAAAFNQAVEFLQSVPFVVPIEIGVIAIPMGFHALYGVYITYLAQNNQLHYTYYRNWLFYLQRLTALITLGFVVWHVWVLRIGKILYGTHISFQYMSQLLSDPLTFILYAIGLSAALFHLTNGLWAFMITWGITIGTRAQRFSMVACSIGFLALSAMGLKALVSFIIY
jgi:succinate dehydrogenase / fumarate reductase cytochrome b subunit